MNRLLLSVVLAAMLAAAMGATSAMAADDSSSFDEWVEKTKHPTEWWSWGADLRLRTIYFKNALFLNKDNPTDVDERSFQRYRARWWSKFDVVENVDLNVRLCWESRTYDKPGPFEEWYGGPVMFDTLNVKVENVMELPVTVTFGRQDIILGDGWLVLDGTPLDGSRTIFFDAFRADWKADENHSLSLIYIDQGGSDDRNMSPFNNTEEDNIEQDERGVIAYYTNKSAIENGQLNAYFMYKHMDALPGRLKTNGGSAFGSWGDNGDIYCVGMRAEKKLGEHWSARAEGAHQFGSKLTANPARLEPGGSSISAFGFNSRLTYSFNDDWKTQIRASYEFLSGDDPHTATNEAFDPMWGRWPQFSELYVYTYAGETRIADVTNLHRVGLGITTHPHEKIETSFDWNLLLADENTYGAAAGFSTNGELRGNLLAAILRYKINEHMYGHLLSEVFFPGNYYDNTRNDPAVFLRAELTLAW